MTLTERVDYLLLKWRARAWLTLGQSTRARQAMDEMLARWPEDAYGLSSRAHLRASQGDASGAIEDARRLVRLHPSRSAADWFNLAFMLEARGDLAEAEPAFRRALELDPKLDRAWYGLGLTLIRQHRLEEAVSALRRTTQLQPMSPYGWYQLARVHMDRSEPEETRKIIRHLQAFEPKVAAQLERETGLRAG
ncbi:MAG: tetratricopeptide repeat protein [Rubrivivax sp.]|jgi:predicted Zn-dependent protease